MGNTIQVKNPATGNILKEVDVTSAADIETALRQGDEAFKSWSKVNAHERSRLLKEWSEKIKEETEQLAEVMTLESGKPLKESRGEVAYAASYIDWYAEEAKRIYGRTIPAHYRIQTHCRNERAGRTCCRHHAVELPGSDDDEKGCSCVSCRMHVRCETCRRNAAHDDQTCAISP